MADVVDIHSRFIVMDDQNKELLAVGLSQRKLMLIFMCLLGLVFVVLVAFNIVETKDIRDLKDLFGLTQN